MIDVHRHRPETDIPGDESARLDALREYQVLDTLPEREFDDLVLLASEICGAPIALLSLVDETRQWFKASVGLGLRQTPRSASFCAHAMQGNELFVVSDAREDARFQSNPLVTGNPQIRFYAGAPLRSGGGHGLGALCVIDRVPRKLSERQARALRTLAKQVETQLNLRRATFLLESQKLALETTQRHKDELVALIVHDFKSPLASILPTARFLQSEGEAPEDLFSAARDIEDSAQTLHRMVLDLLDLSRARDGRLRARLSAVDLLELTATSKASTRRAFAARGCSVEVDVKTTRRSVQTDGELLRRVLGNLLDNALKFTRHDSTVVLRIREETERLSFRVEDQARTIPEADRDRIFEKYLQLGEAGDPAASGRGLGLSFCRLAVNALGGRIWTEPNPGSGNAFCFELPVPRDAAGRLG